MNDIVALVPVDWAAAQKKMPNPWRMPHEPLYRRLRVVADGGDVAAAPVAEHHRLQQVVDVLHGEGQVHPGVAVDLALALEVAHARAEQHHLADRQLG